MSAVAANALPRRGPAVRSGSLTGAGALIRHILRRDRARLAIWIVAVVGFVYAAAYSYIHLYDDEALAAQAAVMRTPTGIVMAGPGYGLDEYTPAAAAANELIVWLVLALSVLSILHVVRHTRGEEESSRAELVRALPVGRHAQSVAALATLAAALVAIAVLGTVALASLGNGFAPADSAAMMFGSASAAFVSGAAALVAAQVTTGSRAAVGIALSVLAVFFVVRAAGDVQEIGGSLLSWFSPIAWAQQLRAFVDVRWWPVALALGAAAVLLALAALLAARRDLGAGLVAPRSGRERASRALSSPFALAWRDRRGALGWTASGLAILLFGTGTMMRSIGDMMADLVDDNAAFAVLFGDDPSAFSSAFLSLIALFVGLGTSASAIASVSRVSSDEASGRLELTLSHPVSRARWFGAQIAVGTLGALVVLCACVIALWAGTASVGVDDPGIGDFARAMAYHAPAVLVFPAISAALIGWTPRFAGAAWAGLAAVFLIDFFGALFDLPDWALGASPFHWAEDAFSPDADPVPILIVAGLVVALAALALVGFRRRDLRTG